MRYLKYLSIILLTNFQIVFCQDVLKNEFKTILDKNISNNEKIEKLQKLQVKYKFYQNSAETGILYAELAKLYFSNNEIQFTKTYLSKSISILKKHKSTHLYDLNRSRNNLAWIYMLKKDYNAQYLILNEIIRDKGKDEFTFDASITISRIEAKHGDYYLSLKRLNLLLAERQTLDNELTIRNTIVKVYAMMSETDVKTNLFRNKTIIENHQNFIEKNFNFSQLDEKMLYEFYNNLANIYESLGEYNTALQFYSKSKEFFKKQGNDYERFFVLNNIGYLYGKQNKIELASKCFKEIINSSSDINQIATAYDNLAYFSKLQPIEKTVFFEKAIQIILEQKQVPFQLPSIETIVDSGYQQDVMVYLVDLASNYVESYRQTKNRNYLFKAKEALYLIDELVSIIRYESSTEQSKLFWIEKGVNTYLLGAEVCYLLNMPQEGFYFMEKNKALLLQETIKTYQAKLELQVPQEIRDKEFSLHYEWVVAEKRFQQFPNNTSLKAAYSKKHKEFESFMTALNRKYPEYVKLKQKIDIISLKNVIKSLDKQECFVTYILNDEKGYGLFVSTTEKIFFEINDVTTVQKNIQKLKNYNLQFLLEKQKSIDFQYTSVRVFKSLFPFQDALGKIKNKKMIIVADNSLLNLPFESLCIDSRSLNRSYLINFAEISYLQSFSTYEKIKQWKNNASKRLLATIPYQFSDKSLPALSRSKEVMDYLAKYSSSKILFDKDATKEGFKSAIKEYGILHLNTHAGVDTKIQTPWIAFRNSKMSLEELYGIQNQAELVILDACKTNEGQMQSGEGILSLSRGFFMNGTKSVLSSLWNVNEKAGNEIVMSFYRELEKGNSKSKALQLAKINYLKHHQFSEVLPYHWASFVLTGDTTPVELSQKWYYNKQVLILFGFIIVLILGILIKFKFLKVNK